MESIYLELHLRSEYYLYIYVCILCNKKSFNGRLFVYPNDAIVQRMIEFSVARTTTSKGNRILLHGILYLASVPDRNLLPGYITLAGGRLTGDSASGAFVYLERAKQNIVSSNLTSFHVVPVHLLFLPFSVNCNIFRCSFNYIHTKGNLIFFF